MVSAQQGAVDAQFKTYKEMTTKIGVNRQATEAAIQQRNQVIQSQQMALQAFQTKQFMNRQQLVNIGNQKWSNNSNNGSATVRIITTTTPLVAATTAGAGILVMATPMVAATTTATSVTAVVARGAAPT
jgi:hypothetical protein